MFDFEAGDKGARARFAARPVILNQQFAAVFLFSKTQKLRSDWNMSKLKGLIKCFCRYVVFVLFPRIQSYIFQDASLFP